MMVSADLFHCNNEYTLCDAQQVLHQQVWLYIAVNLRYYA
jgi:hypothetical protein